MRCAAILVALLLFWIAVIALVDFIAGPVVP